MAGMDSRTYFNHTTGPFSPPSGGPSWDERMAMEATREEDETLVIELTADELLYLRHAAHVTAMPRSLREKVGA